ncbi:MAG: CIA30 family protein [Myxococcota bacterium]
MPQWMRLGLIVLGASCTPSPTDATPSDATPPPRGASAAAAPSPTMNPPLTSRTIDLGVVASSFRAVDDRVMGGVSQSRFTRHADGHGVFSGDVSLEQNGGFASVRAQLEGLDLEGFSRVTLRFRGDGKRYKLRFRDATRRDGILHEMAFPTEDDVWREQTFALDDFRPVWRGRLVADAGPLTRGPVRSVSFLVSDAQVGRFRLDVAWLRFDP